MLVLRQCLGHDVSQHDVCRTVFEFDNPVLDAVAHELKLDIEVLGPRMVNWVIRKRNSPLIVDVDGFRCVS